MTDKTTTKKLQIDGLTAKTLRAAIESFDEILIHDGDDVIAHVQPARVKLERLSSYFMHYPHAASECWGTCWRHDGHAEAEQAPAEADKTEVAAEPVAV